MVLLEVSSPWPLRRLSFLRSSLYFPFFQFHLRVSFFISSPSCRSFFHLPSCLHLPNSVIFIIMLSFLTTFILFQSFSSSLHPLLPLGPMSSLQASNTSHSLLISFCIHQVVEFIAALCRFQLAFHFFQV